MSAEAIRAALAKLDPSNDDQWTGDGLPRIDVVQKLAGVGNLTRGAITGASPQFSRENPSLELPEPITQVEEPGGAPGEPAPDLVVDAGPEAPVELDDGPDYEASAEDLGELGAAQSELSKAEDDLNAAKRKVVEAQRKVDAAIEARPTPGHRETQADIQHYLETQKAERARRALVRGALVNAGITPELLKDITSKAPIDAAMARKRGFGTQRPTRTPGA